jgi:hypothetical protein
MKDIGLKVPHITEETPRPSDCCSIVILLRLQGSGNMYQFTYVGINTTRQAVCCSIHTASVDNCREMSNVNFSILSNKENSNYKKLDGIDNVEEGEIT